MSEYTTACVEEVASMHLVSSTTWALRRLAQHPSPTLSREAAQRHRWLRYWAAHGQNASLTCRHFGISRTTFYRWRARYQPQHLGTLEDRSSRPQHRRNPTWTVEDVLAVRTLREQYPRWGKEKLQRLLERQGVVLSVSMVGRILTHLRHSGQLHEPRSSLRTRKQQRPRPYALRKPREYAVAAPGDLVQVDTLDVRPVPGVVLKHFTARDMVSRWDVLELHTAATASLAAQFLESVLARMPFGVKAIQVDNGSEFMAEFEQACREKQLRLFVLPPRSPKLNGQVERAQRTHTEEFYELCCVEPTVAALGAELRRWENVYNTVRPHQALGYRTPHQFIQSWNQQSARKEGCH